MAELTPGTDYFDYTVERLIGRGGFGVVYLARDRRLDRRVALKILEPHLAADPTARRRFIDESRLAASLDHPNIAPIYEAGEQDEQLFLAMRYVAGPDMADTLDRDGALEPVRAGHIVRQVASALDAAHAAGLIHRDVKPGNVLLAAGTDSTDHAYLTDFGLSKRVGGAGAVSQTEAGRFVGTVGYVAPEQIKGRTIDARADIYSLGCLAYHALTGHQPFERDSEIGTLMAHAEEPPHSVYEALPDLADRVDPVIAKAMAKDPADRYPSAGGFAAELTAALSSRQPGANVTRGFLFADLRDYTAFIEGQGDEAAVRLLDAFRRMVRLVVARYDGAEIKTEGDSFYVVFPSASAAVQAGLGIVAGAGAETERRPELPLAVGVGVHAGESSEWVEGYVGSSVNIAARLCAQAEAGEVLVSDTVRTLIRTSSKLDFVDRGQRTFKGIDEPMATWSAVPRDSNGAAAAPGSTVGPRRVGRSPVLAAIVVLIAFTVTVVAAWLLLGGSDEPGASGANTEPREQVAFSRFIPGLQVDDPDFDACSDPLDAKAVLADLEGSEAGSARLTRGTDRLEYWPSWSADGSTIATIGLDGVSPGRAPSQLYVVDAAGFRPVEVPEGILGQYNGYAAVTDDGADALWKGSDFRGRYHVVALDGSGAETYAAGGDDSDAFRSNLEDVLYLVRPLPDGRILAVWVGGWGGGDDTPFHQRFEAMALDGSDPTAVGPLVDDADVGGVKVSPTGDRVLLMTENWEDGSFEWYIMPLADDSAELTPLDIDALEATWSSDGTSIYLVRAEAPSILVEHDLATGEEREILDIGTGTICGPVARRVRPGTIGLPPAPSADEPPPFEISLLEPGTYRFETFKPAPKVTMEATFGSDWLGRANYPDGWEAMHLDVPTAEFSASRILVGLPGPCAVEDGRVLESGTRGFVDWIEAREDLQISSPRTVSVGGWPGVNFVVTPVPGTECQYTNDWNLYLSEEDIIWMKGDESLELTAIDVEGQTIVIRKRAETDRMEAFSELVDPVLDSVRFVQDE